MGAERYGRRSESNAETCVGMAMAEALEAGDLERCKGQAGHIMGDRVLGRMAPRSDVATLRSCGRKANLFFLQDVSYFVRQHGWREGFLQELRARFHQAVTDGSIIGVPGSVKHLRLGPHLTEVLS